MNKRRIFLGIYALFIVIGLCYIVFLAPEDMFLEKDEDIVDKKNENNVYKDIDVMWSNLLKKQYNYEYKLIYNTELFECSGKLDKTKETGTCTSPSKFGYTEIDKNDEDKFHNIEFLDVEDIYNKVKDKEYVKEASNSGRTIKYNTTIAKMDTEVVVYTNKDDIEKITIANGYLTYILKFSNIIY